MDEQQAPSGLSRLWTLRQGQQASRERVGLSLERIVASAIQIADAGGLEAVSMSRVAQSLGFATMSIYRHVANKDELLLLMHDTAWEVPASLDNPVGTWRESLTQWCRAQFDVSLRHPWLERVRLGERAGTPSQLMWIDRGLRALANTPLSERDKTHVLLLLNGYVFWEARLAAETAVPGDIPPDQVAAAVKQMMVAVADPVRLPALRQALEAGAFDFSETSRFTDAHRGSAFDFGLGLILDGIEQLISRGSTE